MVREEWQNVRFRYPTKIRLIINDIFDVQFQKINLDNKKTTAVN